MRVSLNRRVRKVFIFLRILGLFWLGSFLFGVIWIAVWGFQALDAFQRGDLILGARHVSHTQLVFRGARFWSVGICSELCEELADLSKLAGTFADSAGNGRRSVYFWFQNDMELRPTGGFLGSYARLDLSEGKYQQLLVQDIYVPDGQLVGYVETPYVIKQFLYGGGWKLRDANWDPDFPNAVQAVQWFFTEVGDPPAEAVVAINFGFVEELWKILGTISVPDYGNFDANSLYPFLQAEVEHNFFPGSTKKTDVMGALSRAFLRALENADVGTQVRFALRVLDALPRKDVQLWFADSASQKTAEQAKWGGHLISPTPQNEQEVVDYLNVNEANIGINKANCCVHRELEYTVQVQSGQQMVSSLLMQYRNNNPEVPDPPRHYGGRYLTFLRVFRQPDWQLLSGESDLPADNMTKFSVKNHPNLGIKEFGAILKIPGNTERFYQWNFSRQLNVNLNRPWTYALRLQNQSGSRTPRLRVSLVLPVGFEVTGSTHPGKSEENVWTGNILLNRDRDILFTIAPK